MLWVAFHSSTASIYTSFTASVVCTAVVYGLFCGAVLKFTPTIAAPPIFLTLALLLYYSTAIPSLHWYTLYILSSTQRVQVVLQWAVVITITLPLMLLLARSRRLPTIILRKGYHLLAVALFLPVLFNEPYLLAMSMGLAFAGLVAVEVVRSAPFLPGISQPLHRFMASFVDARDNGAFYITHFTLLLGLALPIWLSLGGGEEGGGVEKQLNNNYSSIRPQVWSLAGIVATGVGDGVASVVGSQWGKRPVVMGSRKTVEGTAAGILACIGTWVLLALYYGDLFQVAIVGKGEVVVVAVVVASVLSGLMEAATEQLDNLFVPLHYFTLLVCLLVPSTHGTVATATVA